MWDVEGVGGISSRNFFFTFSFLDCWILFLSLKFSHEVYPHFFLFLSHSIQVHPIQFNFLGGKSSPKSAQIDPKMKN